MKSILKNTIYVFICLFLIGSKISYATDIKTKIFLKDIKKCEAFITSQHKLLTDFMESLTSEDVEAINSTSSGKIELLNPEVISLFKKLAVTSKSSEPKGVKYGQYHRSGIPRNLLHGYAQNISNYSTGGGDGIVEGYKIPKSDYDEALDSYSNYLIFLLDIVQDLRGKVNDVGLTGYAFPTINNYHISSQGDFNIIFTQSYNPIYGGLPADRIVWDILVTWKKSCKEMPELYNNQQVLLAQKLWIEFVLSSDDLYIEQASGKSHEEEFMVELEKIDKFLARIEGKKDSETENKPTVPVLDKDKSNEQVEPKVKGKFKLDLPQ